MRFFANKKILYVGLLLVVCLLSAYFLLYPSEPKVDFSADVKPLINKHCITCHGGVKAKGGFSLLFRDEAMAPTKSGKPAIIPGDPDHSEMIRRLTLTDPEERMPYQHEPLTKDEINILSAWIKEGAPWGEHWAYIPLKPVAVPDNGSFEKDWSKNEVDAFILQKIKAAGITPSAEADKNTLLRRVSLDLIGMPPSDKIAQQFLADNSSKAYENLVDSLLASPHFGEKWTSMWLDLARYADTKGYERDDSRNIWRYRDWVINAFNNNMPYDSFVIKQIAGDLLPHPTDDDYIATAFHRNTMTNDEGGTDNEEFRTAAVMDRVSTTWQALMGTTFGCVQCHAHPYDPFKHDDYYKFLAFFNDTRDEDTYADYPLLRTFNDTAKQEINELVNWLSKNSSPEKAQEAFTFIKTWQPAINSLICDSFTNSELNDTKWLAFRNHAVCRLQHVDLQGKDHLIFRYAGYIGGGTWQIHIDNANGPIIATIPFTATKDWQISETNIQPVGGVHNLYFTYSNASLTNPLSNAGLVDWLYFTEQFPGKGTAGYEKEKQLYWKLVNANEPTIPVMMDNPADLHRTSYVFERGNWLVKGDKVTPATPASLNAFPKNAPNNRLGLAEWITDTLNPLTSRTMVNRVWEQLFGKGIVETLEDLGTQGAAPTHEQLLNWLSYQFMHNDKWSMKQLIKTIVMSATYQQDSKLTPELQQKDPDNNLYARAPRVRLPAETIRDQALCIAGVMCNKMYGPSVFPYQPKGIWQSPWNGAEWVQSKGEDQYRRALYTYWKRSSPYPSMLTFDGVFRDVCTARRINTNTPLQALTTMNDSAYLDMARHLAERVDSLSKNVTAQIQMAYKLATYHDANTQQVQALEQLYNKAYNSFKTNTKAAKEMMGDSSNTSPEIAALTVVSNAVLNLDEVVTKN